MLRHLAGLCLAGFLFVGSHAIAARPRGQVLLGEPASPREAKPVGPKTSYAHLNVGPDFVVRSRAPSGVGVVLSYEVGRWLSRHIGLAFDSGVAGGSLPYPGGFPRGYFHTWAGALVSWNPLALFQQAEHQPWPVEFMLQAGPSQMLIAPWALGVGLQFGAVVRYRLSPRLALGLAARGAVPFWFTHTGTVLFEFSSGTSDPSWAWAALHLSWIF